mgnify:CR=1 FL=1
MKKGRLPKYGDRKRVGWRIPYSILDQIKDAAGEGSMNELVISLLVESLTARKRLGDYLRPGITTEADIRALRDARKAHP